MRPATTGAVSPGNHIQTYASCGRDTSEIIVDFAPGLPDRAGQQGESVAGRLDLGAERRGFRNEQIDPCEGSGFQNEADGHGRIAFLDELQGASGDPYASRKIMLGHAPAFAGQPDPLAEEKQRLFGKARICTWRIAYGLALTEMTVIMLYVTGFSVKHKRHSGNRQRHSNSGQADLLNLAGMTDRLTPILPVILTGAIRMEYRTVDMVADGFGPGVALPEFQTVSVPQCPFRNEVGVRIPPRSA